MGVHGLWELLAPVGRRVSVETLAGKKLAIDASIWIIQFMKAMRDERGEMVKNGHLLGFFRRICKLLFLRTRPVFVFDGGTPAIKRRTVIARRRQRENAQAKIRKTAEKLLLNHLKAMKLKEIANNKCSKGKEVIENECMKTYNAENEAQSSSFNLEKVDAMLAASIEREENCCFIRNADTTDSHTCYDDNDSNESDEIILPETQGNVDPAVLASLPPSMQLDLLVQMRERLMADNRQRYQKVKKVPEKFSELQIKSYLKTIAFRREINEVQRSSAGRGMGGLQTSRIASESNREFIFSSSFSGDKKELLSSEVEGKEGENQKVGGASNFSDFLSSCVSDRTPQAVTTEAGSAEERSGCGGGLMDGLETYTDERGNVRLSRLRALGIRMTRDIQRNLDMIKEMEEENSDGKSPEKGGISIDILLDDKNDTLEEDAEVFAGLVKGGSKEEKSEDSADFDWEDGNTGGGSFPEGGDYGSCFIPEHSVNSGVLSVGEMEEDVDINEAVRRSLEDNQRPKKEKAEDSSGTFCEQSGNSRVLSLGEMEEEADFKEAVRRSLEDNGRPKHLEEDDNGDRVKKHNMGFPNVLEDGVVPAVEKSNGDGTCSSVRILESRVEDDHDIKKRSTSNLMERDPLTTNEGNPVFVYEEKMEAVAYEGNKSASEDNIQIDPMVDESQQFGFIGLVGEDPPQWVWDEKNMEEACGFCNDPVSTWGGEDLIVGDVATNDKLLEGVSVVNLEEEIQILDREIDDLGDEQRKLQRNAESVSSEMFSECQELLQMFGLPYIIAPMEAEAQCAYLENANLVDAVVTDDADAFLFGARNVHKNIFDDRKYVETYLMKDIEIEIGLTQKKLIDMALLLGSDYTEGISGIGIVNAIEVVNAFPEENGLQKFREWIESPDPTILQKVGVGGETISHKRGRKQKPSGPELEPDSEPGPGPAADRCWDEVHHMKRAFMEQHRNVSKNWHIPSTFPSDVVVAAYLTPQVDKSTEPFSWGKPDLLVLRRMCRERFGWVVQKADELLLPVLKEYEKHETQLRLESFYSFNERFAKIRSRRICRAVKGITGTLLPELSIHPGPTPAPSDRPKKRNKRAVGNPPPRENQNKRKEKREDKKGEDFVQNACLHRRSKRARKQANYVLDDSEGEEEGCDEAGEPKFEYGVHEMEVSSRGGGEMGDGGPGFCTEGGGSDYLVVGGGFCGPGEVASERE